MFDKLDAYNLSKSSARRGAHIRIAFSDFPAPPPDKLGAFLLVSFVAGVTANRLGSLILDPILRKSKFLKPKDYLSFLVREKADTKLDALVANSGLYRTFFTAGLIYLVALMTSALTADLSDRALFIAFVFGGMIVFLFALRKEDGYIHSRIEAEKDTGAAKPN